MLYSFLQADATESLTLQLDESNAALAATRKDKERLEQEVNVSSNILTHNMGHYFIGKTYF